MSEIVTSTGSVVGFTNGHPYGYGYGYNHGVSDKDQGFTALADAGERTRDVLGQGFASSIDAGERTRDILAGQRFSDTHLSQSIYSSILATEKIGAAGITATEKTGAASALATEKIGAAAILTAEKIGAASVLATEKIGFQTQLQAEQRHTASLLAMQDFRREVTLQIETCCCGIKQEIAEVKATVLATDAQRIRDDLAQCRAELLASRRGPQ